MEMAKKSNAEYWEERIAQKTWSTYNDLENRNRALLEFYQDASKSIREELYKIAEKYSKDGTLSRSDMYRYDHYDNLDKKFLKIVDELGKKELELAVKEMKDGFKQVYQDVGISLGEPEFSLPDKKLMQELLDRPWRGDSFSGRMWKNRNSLAAGLNDVLLTGLQQGKTATEIAVLLHNIVGNSFNKCHRIVRTETMHYLNMAALQRYKDGGIARVRIWAAADERTCEHCMQYHDKVYPIDKAPVLPLHPN